MVNWTHTAYTYFPPNCQSESFFYVLTINFLNISKPIHPSKKYLTRKHKWFLLVALSTWLNGTLCVLSMGSIKPVCFCMPIIEPLFVLYTIIFTTAKKRAKIQILEKVHVCQSLEVSPCVRHPISVRAPGCVCKGMHWVSDTLLSPGCVQASQLPITLVGGGLVKIRHEGGREARN